MRLSLCALALALSLGCDPQAAGPEQDTPEAWRAWLESHPSATDQLRGNARVQDLLLDRARRSEDPADYDAYLEAFPAGAHAETARAEREKVMFRAALLAGTPDRWERFLQDYPKARGGHDRIAKEGLDAARYAPHMKMGPVKTRQVNLAEDPDGPLDGISFEAEITNEGAQTLEAWWLRIFYLDDQGNVLDRRKWPLVAKPAEFPVPMPPEASEPLKPGETRTWAWATGDLPEGFSGQVRLVPMRVRFAQSG